MPLVGEQRAHREAERRRDARHLVDVESHHTAQAVRDALLLHVEDAGQPRLGLAGAGELGPDVRADLRCRSGLCHGQCSTGSGSTVSTSRTLCSREGLQVVLVGDRFSVYALLP